MELLSLPIVKRRPIVEKKIPIRSAWTDTCHDKVGVLAKKLRWPAERLLVVN